MILLGVKFKQKKNQDSIVLWKIKKKTHNHDAVVILTQQNNDSVM